MKKFTANNYLIEEPIFCPKCTEEYYEVPRPYKSLSEFMQIEAGFTILGIQIWCKRHKCNVCHIDFDGHTVKTFMELVHQTTN